MKKKLFITLGLVGLITLSISIGVYAASDIKLLINGKAVNADIQIVNGSSYVPLRVVSESLGGLVKWDGDARTISITSGTPAPTPTIAPTPKIPIPTPTPFEQTEHIYQLNEAYTDGDFMIKLVKITKTSEGYTDFIFEYQNKSSKSWANDTVATLNFPDPNDNSAAGGGIMRFVSNGDVAFKYPANSSGQVHLAFPLNLTKITDKPIHVRLQYPLIKWNILNLVLD